MNIRILELDAGFDDGKVTGNLVYKTIDFTLQVDLDDLLSFGSNDKSIFDDIGDFVTHTVSDIGHGIDAVNKVLVPPVLQPVVNPVGSIFQVATGEGIASVLGGFARTDFVQAADVVVDKLEALGDDLESGFRAVVHVGRS